MHGIVQLIILVAAGCGQSDSEKFAEIRRQMESAPPPPPISDDDIDHTGPAADRSFRITRDDTRA